MEVSTMVTLGIAVVLVGYAIVIYNNLVALKHGVSQAWSNIDVALEQRHDKLTKLLEVCRQYMAYEQETLERVARIAAEHLDLAALRELADRALDLQVGVPTAQAGASPDDRRPVRLGVLRDRAFSFYYPDNLERLIDETLSSIPPEATVTTVEAAEAPVAPKPTRQPATSTAARSAWS